MALRSGLLRQECGTATSSCCGRLVHPRVEQHCQPPIGCGSTLLPRRARRRAPLAITTRASDQPNQQQEEVLDASYDFVGRRQGFFRALPLAVGALGVIGILVNRLVSGIAPVVDASSAQSRTDVLGIGLSAVLLLTGLQWLSLTPKPQTAVPLEGSEVQWLDESCTMSDAAAAELDWAWEALRTSTRTKSMTVFLKGRQIYHAGYARPGFVPGTATMGDTCEKSLSSGKGNYLANLTLFPGRAEFLSYLPEGTQGVVVQPIGTAGMLVVATDTVRGFGRLDQAWVSTLADKMDVSLESAKVPQPGAGFGGGGKAAKR